MDTKRTISAFVRLGKWLGQIISGEEDETLKGLNQRHLDLVFEQIETEHNKNGWFTADYIKKSIEGIVLWLNEDKLTQWSGKYNIYKGTNPKKVGLVLAGNIPFVGFHDLLCVLMSGHTAICKLSSKDDRLFKNIINVLLEIEPGLKDRIVIVDDRLKGFNAVIATGSNNTSRYFDYYFGKYPHIIRHNRNSLALLTGKETKEELMQLADDIFMYYGLGCRNVSALMVPEDYNFNLFFESMEHYNYMLNHNKYMNNHDYYRSIYLVNQAPHLDNGFLILKEEELLASPISVLYYQKYKDLDHVKKFINTNIDQIQCVVSNSSLNEESVPFGHSQKPELNDYADNIDTMNFLCSL